MDTIQKQLDGFNNQINSINQIVEKGIHNQNFPDQRTKKLEQFSNIYDSYKEQIFEIERVIRLFKHEELITDSEALGQALDEAKRKIDEVDKEYKDAKKTLGDIRDLSMVKSLKESAGTFEKLRSNHSGQEKTWRNVFWASLLGTLVAVIIIVLIDFDTSTVATVIGDAIKKLLIISVPALLTKVSLKKYNLERNLIILYSHRATVLKQYQNFENAIGDDQDAKNSFRLEIAKYIFSDPQTGYIGDGKSNEVSVNPIINLAERMASKIE